MPDELAEDDAPTSCWCGEPDAHFDDDVYSRDCGGLGTLYCYCGGGDTCVCHNHGEVDCPGCDDCRDGDDGDGYDADEEDYRR